MSIFKPIENISAAIVVIKQTTLSKQCKKSLCFIYLANTSEAKAQHTISEFRFETALSTIQQYVHLHNKIKSTKATNTLMIRQQKVTSKTFYISFVQKTSNIY